MHFHCVSCEMSTHSSYYNYDEGGEEHAAAVAAAAFAISSFDSAQQDQKRKPERITFPLKIKSRRKDSKTDTQRSDKDDLADKSYQRRPSRPQSRDRDGTLPENVIHPVPSRKRSATFSVGDKRLQDTNSKKTESETRKPVSLPPPTHPLPTPRLREEFQKFRVQETEADLWERDKFKRITEKYEKLNASILEWEDKKKKKAKSKLDITESELQQRRVKALQHYQTDMERIKQIAEGARAEAKEKRRKEELKVKDKADKFRATGKLPATCLCF